MMQKIYKIIFLWITKAGQQKQLHFFPFNNVHILSSLCDSSFSCCVLFSLPYSGIHNYIPSLSFILSLYMIMYLDLRLFV